jgi:four helix bundle protein
MDDRSARTNNRKKEERKREGEIRRKMEEGRKRRRAWRKRRYKAVFINKLSDAEQEAGETQTWLEFALKCHYIDEKTFERLDKQYEEIFAVLFGMGEKADTFCRQ